MKVVEDTFANFYKNGSNHVVQKERVGLKNMFTSDECSYSTIV